jgi:N-acetylglutamate synthase-like GNAT family acetyltransferase
MIRVATKYDKTQIIELMKRFRSESKIEEFRELNNEEYWNRLLDTILAGSGIIYIEDGKGLIMGLITPSIWCDKTLTLQELAWYVLPKYRNTSIGYKLFLKYIEFGKQIKKEGRIKFFAMGKLSTSPNLKYEKYGFKKIDENWMQ